MESGLTPRTQSLEKYSTAFFEGIRHEFINSQDPIEREGIHQRVDTVADTLFENLEKHFNLFAGDLGIEKKDWRFDFGAAYGRFLDLAKNFTADEKDRPLFERIKAILVLIDTLPKRPKKEEEPKPSSAPSLLPAAAQGPQPSSAPSLLSATVVPTLTRSRVHDPKEADLTRGDVPRSANPFDINSVSKNLHEYKKKELDFMILIACIDGEMRETVTLSWSASTCILEIIDALLAQPEAQRDLPAAQIRLQERLQEMEEEEVGLYKSLLGAREQIIQNGQRVDITAELKKRLLTSFRELVRTVFEGARKEFPLTPELDLAHVKKVLEERIEDKLLLKDDLLESKVGLYNQSEDLKATPEFKSLRAERKRLQGVYASSDMWEAVENKDKERLKEELESKKGFLERVLPSSWVPRSWKSLNVANSLGYTPLHIACFLGLEEFVDELLSNGATRDIRDSAGYNALHWAACQGHTSICRKLLAKEPRLALLNSQAQGFDKDGIELGYKRNALHRAAWHGHVETVQFLIEAGIDVNAHASKGDGSVTPLHEAVNQDKDRVVFALLACDRLDVERVDSIGRTPLYYAALKGKTDYFVKIVTHRSYRRGKPVADPNSLETILTKVSDPRVQRLLQEMIAKRDH